MARFQYRFMAGLLCFGVWAYPMAAQAISPMKEDKVKVQRWNDFAQALMEIHEKQITTRKTHTKTSYGGYYKLPKFYQEVSYYDDQNQRLLSRIQWERENPDTLHQVEVFIYDDQGRVIRDYLAAYLPRFRNAPIITLINFHQYNGELRSFRQFDASGTPIYEQCKGRNNGQEVFLSIEEHEFSPGPYANQAMLNSELYQRCFSDAPKQAGRYLQPRNELRHGPPPMGLPSAVSVDEVEQQIAEITAQLAKQPDDTRLLIKRGDDYFLLQRFSEAIEDYTRAIDLDDRQDEAYFGRGMALGRSGQIRAGIADLSVYLERHPNDSRAYTKRGVRYLWLGDEASAEKDLRRAIALDPGNAEAHDDLGVILARRGDYPRALDHFATTVKLDPSYQKGFHNMAMVYLLSGKDESALRAVDSALALQPEARDTLLLKAEILHALGDGEAAQHLRDEAEFLPEGNWSEQMAVQ